MNSKKKEMLKCLYTVLQEAKGEINQLRTNYDFFKNIDLKININSLKDKSCQKFLKLTESKPNDPNISEYLENIKTYIDYENSSLYNKLRSDMISIQNTHIISKIINIIKNPEEEPISENSDSEYDNEYDYGIYNTHASIGKKFIFDDEYDDINDDDYDDINDDDDISEDDKKMKIQQKISEILDKESNKLIFDIEKL